MRTQNKKSGFTLVELMVVAAIIAILAAIIIPLLSKNKEAAVAADGHNIGGVVLNAQKAHYARTGNWVTVGDLRTEDEDLDKSLTDCRWDITALDGNAGTVTCTLKAAWQGYSGSVSLASTGDWDDNLVKATR